jgi:hypothetical protein
MYRQTDRQMDGRTDGQTDELIRIELGNLFGSYRLIPALKKECKGKDDSTQKTVPTVCTLLSQFEIRPPSYTAVLRWVHYLGFSQDKTAMSMRHRRNITVNLLKDTFRS